MMYNVFYAFVQVFVLCSVAAVVFVLIYHGWWKHRTPSAERMSEEEKLDGQQADAHLEAGLAELRARQAEDDVMQTRRAERRRIKAHFPRPSDEELQGMSEKGCVILQVYREGEPDPKPVKLHMFSSKYQCPPDFFVELQGLL